jgi:hypothetical protein
MLKNRNLNEKRNDKSASLKILGSITYAMGKFYNFTTEGTEIYTETFDSYKIIIAVLF